jgi:alkylation response protein AidB-like acyl-CoA dehydrogenase
MDFEFSDEQSQLQDSISGFLAKEYTFERLRAIKGAARGWDPAVWKGLAELGVPAINVPTAQGGLGYGPSETLALMTACGPSLVLDPLIGSAIMATTLLAAHVSQEPAAQLLGKLAAGDSIAAVAHFEPDARFDPRWVTTRAHRTGEGYRLKGGKSMVLHAGAADALLVSARTAGEAQDVSGVTLFLLPRGAAGVRLEEYINIDGQLVADVHLDDAPASPSCRLGAEGAALPSIEAALDAGLAAVCAEAVGIMQALVGATVEHLNTRQQFGQPIGRFQALQHRVADMVIHLEQARSMSYLAAMCLNSGDAAERARTLSAAKVVVGEACRFIGQQAVQLHGGMGMTDELQVSHWFKRLTVIELLFGDSDAHLQRYAEAMRGALSLTATGDSTARR